MAKHNAFLDIVKERPDWSIKSKPICPFCKSKNVKKGGNLTTLVAGKYNHIWNKCECNKCHKTFTMETKERGNLKPIRWYTKDGKILKGIPGCFESYIYTCSKCGGNVVRKHLKPDSDEEATILSAGPDKNGVWIKHYRTFFHCEKCGIRVESENDSYGPKPKEMTYEQKVKAAKNRGKLRLGWKIYEEPGICIINNYALAKVETKE